MAPSPRIALAAFVTGLLLEGSVSLALLVGGPGLVADGVLYGVLVGLALLGFVWIGIVAIRWRRFEPRSPPPDPDRMPWPLLVLLSNSVARISATVGRRRSDRRADRGSRSPWQVVSLVAAGGTGIALELEAGEMERRPAWWRPWRAVLLASMGAFAVTLLAIVERIPGPGGPSPAAVAIVGALLVLLFGTIFDDLRRLLIPFEDEWVRALGWSGLFWALAVAVIAGVELGNSASVLLVAFATNWGELLHQFAPVAFEMSLLAVTYLLLALAFLGVLARFPFEEEDDPELRPHEGPA